MLALGITRLVSFRGKEKVPELEVMVCLTSWRYFTEFYTLKCLKIVICVSPQFKKCHKSLKSSIYNIISTTEQNQQKPNTCTPPKMKVQCCSVSFPSPWLSQVPGTRELLEEGTRVLLAFIFSLVSCTVPTHSTVLNKSHSAALSPAIWEGRGLCQRGHAFICFICVSTFSFFKGFYCFKKTERKKEKVV